MTRVDVAPSPNTRKRIPTLYGRFPRERIPSKRWLQLGYRRSTLLQLALTLTRMHCPRLNTAFQALFGSRALKLAQPSDPTTQDGTWIFIYGGSTSVGLYATQLAKASGYKVVTVASPRNHELIKSYGADAVFDVTILLSAPRLALQ